MLNPNFVLTYDCNFLVLWKIANPVPWNRYVLEILKKGDHNELALQKTSMGILAVF